MPCIHPPMGLWQTVSRRGFLERSLASAGLLLAPRVLSAAPTSPSDRISLGFIGMGGMGTGHLTALVQEPDVQVAAVCDVDQRHLARAVKEVGEARCQAFSDFRDLLARDDIDAVVIATPDHWHGLIAIAAAKAGKHIYCEKPLTNSIAEGRAVCQAVADSQVVLQTGSHERSNPGPRIARQLIAEGRFGEIKTVRIHLPTDEPHLREVIALKTAPPTMPVPEGFDYDFWLGHTPEVSYTEKRCHFWWRFHSAFGGGEMTDRGAHVIDLAQMILGLDDTGPDSIRASGKPLEGEFFDAILDFSFENTYANGLRMIGDNNGPRGVRFEGTDGSLFVEVHGGALTAEPASLLDGVSVSEPKNYATHRRDFLEAIKTGSAVLAPAEAGHRTATICHLNNIALRLGKGFAWDPTTETADDPEVNALLKPAMRAPWTL